MPMRPCDKCLENRWEFKTIREEDEKFTRATCILCGNEVDFNFKKVQVNKIEAKAEYKIKDGKRFLKIDGEYKEVGLEKTKKGFKIMPILEIRHLYLPE